MEREKLISQVKGNCDIADARSWGYFSICGLLLRLRELYRSEHSIEPWEGIALEEMSAWIASKEKIWERLAREDLRPLVIDGMRYDPFQVDEVNAALNSHGLVYGAGYGIFNKPTFFLALLSSKRDLLDYRIYYSGKELCRDISAPVAMLQGRCIFMRLEQLTSLLWGKFQELQGKRFGGALREAYSSFGIGGTEFPSEELQRRLSSLSSEISELLILHEVGEAFEGGQDDAWLSILNREWDRWTEFHLRGIKDVLADTSERGPLKYVIDHEERSLFFFYVAMMDGIRKELFPEMLDAFQHFSEHRDWSVVETARIEGYRRADKLRNDILSLDRRDGEVIKSHLERVKKSGW